MRASDAFAWYMERDPALRSTAVGICWLDRAPHWDKFVDRIDRMSRQMVSLRQRVVESPFRLATPRWTNDDHFDLNWHLRRVNAPEPRTRDAVLELARLAAMDTFDRARPLWEFTLVEGMKGGKAAVVLKIHHSLSDGVGWMQMMGVLFDLERDPGDLGPMPSAPMGETLGRRALITGALTSMVGRVARRTCTRSDWWGSRPPGRRCFIRLIARSAPSGRPPRWRLRSTASPPPYPTPFRR